MKDFIIQKCNVILFFFFVGIVLFIVVTHDNGKHDDRFQMEESLSFDKNWYYEFENGSNGITHLPGNLYGKGSKKLTLMNRLPELKPTDNLFYRVRHVFIRVYVDGELRVDTMTGVDPDKNWGKLEGIYYKEIPLTVKDSGKEVVIESFCNTNYYLKSPGTIYLGERSSLILKLIQTRWKTLMCCTFLALLGVFLFALWAMETYVLKQSSKEVLCLACFCFLVSIWLFTESEFGQFFIKDTGKLTILAYEVLMLMPVPISLFFVYYSERLNYRKASNIVATLPLVVFIINNTLHSLHLVHLADTLIITQVMLAFETISIAVIQVVGLQSKYKKKDEYNTKLWMIPLFGIAMLVPMACLEVIKYAFFSTKYPNDGILISFGILFYMFALAFDTIVRMNSRAERFKQSSEIKSQFLANMSHEIRTPLNAILGFNEVILRTASDKKILKYSNDIHEAGITLKSIINSILDISKIESGKLEIHTNEYSSLQLLDHIISMFESQAKKKGLTLVTHIDENLPEMLVGDEGHIFQVLMNIVSNAVKYTEHGSITLTIQVILLTEKECRLLISVKDTGIGIKEEDMSRLFEKFERLDERRNYKTEGTGLGMSIVVSLLHAMNSEIKVRSIYGQGSEFYFEIIQGIVSQDKVGSFLERRNEYLMKGKIDEQFIAPDARILVVDDLKMNLDTACALLEQLEMHIDTAMSGKEAIEKVEKNQYDLIYMDHMMPEMDGIEATKRIRKLGEITKNEYYKTLPIIALTANAIVGMREKFIQSGMQDFISKPIEINKLYMVTKRWLPDNKIISKDTEDSVDVCFDEKSKPCCIVKETAMQYCPTEELLIRNIKTFTSTYQSTRAQLEEYCQQQDLTNYMITVHGLKSTSKMIGLDNVSELAKEQEERCQNGNCTLVWDRNQELLEKYQESVTDLIKYLESSNPIHEEKDEVKELSMEEYNNLCKRIQEAALSFNMGEFLVLEEEMEHTRVPSSKQQEFEKIKEMVVNASFGDLIDYLNKRQEVFDTMSLS